MRSITDHLKICTLSLAAAITVLSACSLEPADLRPSILLVVIDTLRADAVSAYGAVEGSTPAFDTLAADGLLYEHAYAPSPWTLPSHASLFTGLRVDRHGVGSGGNASLSTELTTIAERMREAGYETAGFSENPLVSEPFGLAQGFHQFAAVTIEQLLAGPSAAHFDVVERVQNFTTRRNPSRPYFLFVNLLDAHEPYRTRENDRFIPPGLSVEKLWPPARLAQTRSLICDRLPNPTELELLRGLYLGGVAAADQKLGAIVELARLASGASQLIVVATSDHGEHLGEQRLLDHQFSVRAPLLHVPLVVNGLREATPARIEEPVELADVAASVLRWAGLEAPAELAGRPLPIAPSQAQRPSIDLFALYSDEPGRPPDELGQGLEPARDEDSKRAGCGPRDRVFGNMAALTRWPFKLIWFQRYPAELYDLSWDPMERSDLAAQRPDVAEPLLEQARQLMDEAGLAAERNDAAGGPSAEEREALRALGYGD